jgi:very-short-patch-repair endonuclease
MPDFRPRPTALAQSLRNHATDAERHFWRHLSRRQLRGYKFSRQMPIGPFVCDFLCRDAQLVVEIDGGQHDRNADRDASHTHYLEAEGFRVIRFWNNDVLENVEGVLTSILGALQAGPPPTPPAGGRGV